MDPCAENFPGQKGSTAKTSRLMLPDDANIAGNVHGGTTLKMIEQCGWLAAARHCNGGVEGGLMLSCPTVRIEKMDFHLPIFIGDVATLRSRVVFTSDKSVAVRVQVFAENPMTNSHRLCNEALVWYCAIKAEAGGDKYQSAGGKLLGLEKVKPFAPENEEERTAYEEARAMYLARKSADEAPAVVDTRLPPPAAGARKACDSYAELSQVLLPSDCTPQSKVILGGVLLKIMDSAAGVVAYKHCRTNVVTAAIDSIDLEAPICLGDIAHVRAKATFASSRSLEIEVTALAESPDLSEPRVAAVGLFTFVSLDPTGRPQPIPPLQADPADARLWGEAKARYEARKRAREAAKAKAAAAQA